MVAKKAKRVPPKKKPRETKPKPGSVKDITVEQAQFPVQLKSSSGKKIAVHGLYLKAGMTLALRDYESARFDVGIQVSPMELETTREELAEVGWGIIMDELGQKIKATREKLEKEEKSKK